MNQRLKKIKEYFNGHELTVELDTESTKVYLFKNPKDSNLWQRWILNNGSLIVLGDAHDSIYTGGAFGTLESIANCNVAYFSSKCEADRDGRDQNEFNPEKATESIHELIIQNFEDEINLEESGLSTIEKIQEISEHIEKKEGVYYPEIPEEFNDEYEAVIWLRENTELVGQDWWDGFSMKKKKNAPFWHLAAIKTAVEKMQEIEW